MTTRCSKVPATNFPPLKNDLIIRAAYGEPVPRVPVWILRQASRYLPEFGELLEKHEFFEACRNPELACEVTLQPLRRFDLDAAIIFSDIFVIPQALGMVVEMVKVEGPVFPQPLVNPEDIRHLKYPCNVKEELTYVFEAITLTRKKIDGKVPLIGFAGAPWTLMVYMIEGGPSKTHSKAKRWLYMHATESHKLLKMLTDTIIDYLVEQVNSGAQLLQVFDSNAGVLSEDFFYKFSLPYLKEIVREVKKKLCPEKCVPMILFAKDTHFALRALNDTDYDVIALDWTINRRKARNDIPNKSLMGNLDPCAIYANLEYLDSYVYNMIKEFGCRKYIANLGQGIYIDMDPEHVEAFVNAVHKHSGNLAAGKTA